MAILTLAYCKTRRKEVAALVAIVAMILFFSTVIPFAIKQIIRQRKKRKYLNSGIGTVDKMTGEEFEEFLLCHFKKLGYSGHTTPTTGDYGADLVMQNGCSKIVLQAKRYTGKVKIDAVQQVIGAKGYYKADKGIVVTNNYYGRGAINLAKSNGIELWDRTKLIQIMSETKK